MGLVISVGNFHAVKDDPQLYEGRREQLERIDRALTFIGLPTHNEPNIDILWQVSTGYRTIHYLRRVAAYLQDG